VIDVSLDGDDTELTLSIGDNELTVHGLRR
jgi:hypothetical protein